MSRIGKLPINIPSGVTVTVKETKLMLRARKENCRKLLLVNYCNNSRRTSRCQQT